MQDQYELLHRRRREALVSTQALQYYLLCVETGITESNLESSLLYNQGLLEAQRQKPQIKKPTATSYQQFLAYHTKQEISLILDRDETSKRESLRTHFPGRFGSKGKQPLTRYDTIQLGALYQRIYEYATAQRKAA